MDERKRFLRISKKELNRWNKLMHVEMLDYDAERIERFSCVDRWSMDFGDGYEMDLKVCSGDSACCDPLWCEVVLFKNGAEVACSDVFAELGGVWTLEYNNISFVLVVIGE